MSNWVVCFFQGVPEKKLIPVTVPKSPVFALKNRIRVPVRDDEVIPWEEEAFFSFSMTSRSLNHSLYLMGPKGNQSAFVWSCLQEWYECLTVCFVPLRALKLAKVWQLSVIMGQSLQLSLCIPIALRSCSLCDIVKSFLSYCHCSGRDF